MSVRRFSTAVMVTAILGFMMTVGTAIAHHSSTPFYDPERRVEIQGTVTRFVFRNPHAFLYVDVAGANGQTSEWQIELGAPVSLRRTGWTPDTLTVGTEIIASGRPSRAEGSQGLCCVRMTRGDGSPILEGGRVEEAVQPPA